MLPVSVNRPYVVRRYGRIGAPAHIWCGVSVEDRAATTRVRHLQQAPVPVRFLSIEPLLGPVGDIDLNGISWVIVGGESGPKARPMREEWVLHIRDLCQRLDVAFFFKQWGGTRPKSRGRQLQGTEYNNMPAWKR